MEEIDVGPGETLVSVKTPVSRTRKTSQLCLYLKSAYSINDHDRMVVNGKILRAQVDAITEDEVRYPGQTLEVGMPGGFRAMFGSTIPRKKKIKAFVISTNQALSFRQITWVDYTPL